MLAALEAVLDTFESPDLPDLPPLHAGLVGYLGYDVVREVEHLPDMPPDDLGHPDAVLAVIGQLAAFDHWRQRVVLVDNVVVDAEWDRRPSSTPPTTRGPGPAGRAGGRLLPAAVEQPVGPCPSGAAPSQRRRAHHVGRGLPGRGAGGQGAHRRPATSSRWCCPSASTSTLGADPFDVYRVLRLVNPSPYLYFLRFPEVTVVGSSPEPMVRLRDGMVISRPIAGSRPAGRPRRRTTGCEGELVEDPKELAEHVMLVDLARNDVGPGGARSAPRWSTSSWWSSATATSCT